MGQSLAQSLENGRMPSFANSCFTRALAKVCAKEFPSDDSAMIAGRPESTNLLDPHTLTKKPAATVVPEFAISLFEEADKYAMLAKTYRTVTVTTAVGADRLSVRGAFRTSLRT